MQLQRRGYGSAKCTGGSLTGAIAPRAPIRAPSAVASPSRRDARPRAYSPGEQHWHELPLKHVVKSQQFSKEALEVIFAEALKMEKVRPGTKDSKLLDGWTMATLFYEPSTRTRLSFESAIGKLGGTILSTESAGEYSSAAKGETLEGAPCRRSGQQRHLVDAMHSNRTTLRIRGSALPLPFSGPPCHHCTGPAMLTLARCRPRCRRHYPHHRGVRRLHRHPPFRGGRCGARCCSGVGSNHQCWRRPWPAPYAGKRRCCFCAPTCLPRRCVVRCCSCGGCCSRPPTALPMRCVAVQNDIVCDFNFRKKI